jgi:hypothetical protein
MFEKKELMWNNRIVKHEKDDAVWYSVHEVFYNDNGGINGYTEDPISIVGETVEDVKSQLKMIMKDIEKHEVIDASTVKFEDWAEAFDEDWAVGDAVAFLDDLENEKE